MIQFRMFWNITVRPFIEPFRELVDHITAKFMLGISWVILWYHQLPGATEELQAIGMELVTFPPKLWLGLNMLIFCDFLFGSIRAIVDSNIRFSVHRWTRTAYKFAAYNGACLIVAIVANMFPTEYSVLQYATYFILAGQEVFSGMRNLGLMALMTAIWEVAKSGEFSIQKIIEHTESHAREEKKQHEQKLANEEA